ncbi:MAG: hypothetical protein JXA66_00930 [Oligoflexia bacterium]|nr:hypothetical protein [Oligoflexia bacterium]
MERRKIKLIKKQFQYKYSILITLIGAFIFLLFIIPTYYIINSNYNLFINTGIQMAPEVVEALEAEKRLIVYGFFFIFSICSILLFIVSITFTHKIAGPVFALERSITKLLNGNLQDTMSLRKSDDLQELEQVYERVREHLLKKEHTELQTLTDLKKSPDVNSKLTALIKEKEERLAHL